MTIKGKKYILSPRKTKDVLDLVEASKNQEENNLSSFIIMAQVICDSSKATYKNLSFLKKIFTKRISLKYLLVNLSAQEIQDYFNEVIELEGGKKKMTGNQ